MDEELAGREVTAPIPDNGEERISLGTPSEIKADPTRHIADDAAPIERPRAPSVAGSAMLELVKAAGIPKDTFFEVMQWAEHGPTQSDSDLAARDVGDRAEAESELRSIWGADKWDRNVKALDKLLDGLPGNAGEVIRSARLADGRAVLNDAALVQRLLALANRPGPKGSSDPAAEIRKIEAFMRRNRSAYFRDEPMQARYRELLSQGAGA